MLSDNAKALAVATAIVTAGGAAIWTLAQRHRTASSEDRVLTKDEFKEVKTTQEREWRVASEAVLAPAPAASGDGLLGPDGADGYGYSRRYVDALGLRTMLKAKNFKDIERLVGAWQNRFETDWHAEQWVVDAIAALSAPEPELEPILNEWVTTRPGWLPLTVRGKWWLDVGQRRRGARWAQDTAKSDFESMHRAMDQARADLGAVAKHRTRVLPALIASAWVEMFAGGRTARDQAIDAAIANCPACFFPRMLQQSSLEPRWGGFNWRMRLAAASAPTEMNPRLKVLRGFADADEADMAVQDEHLPEALAAIDRAFLAGESPMFFMDRSEIRSRAGQHDGAIADARRAVELRPAFGPGHTALAKALLRAGRLQEAVPVWRTAMQFDATATGNKFVKENLAAELVKQAQAKRQAGDLRTAVELVELAAAVWPEDSAVQINRLHIVQAQPTPAPAATAEDEFREVQRRDYQLARERKFEEILPLWGAYLTKHPSDGRAYLERGGTYYHLRRYPESLADASKACALGVDEGCLRARQLGPQQR